MQKFIVSSEQAGSRLDRLIALQLGLSRRCARLLISSGRVRLGGRCCRILTRVVKAGTSWSVEADAVHAKPTVHAGAPPVGAGKIKVLGQARKSVQPHDTVPEVLFADRWLVAINKPAGLLSEGDRFGGPCVISWLSAHFRRQQASDALWLVHRLDAGTSGVLLLARHRRVAALLGACFRERSAKKTYLALVHGVPNASSLLLNGAIARVAGTRHAVRPEGKSACTEVTVLCQSESHALVQAAPLTGRTHQIRVHLSHAGLPIMGDRLYGGPGYGPTTQGVTSAPGAPIRRPMLHAASLTIRHPKTLQTITFTAPVPTDFNNLVAALKLGH